MSKLADLIRRAVRLEPAPIGFGSAGRRAPATLVLAALVAERWSKAAAEAVEAGADLVLLTGKPSEKEIDEAVAAADGRSCGILASQADRDQMARLREAGSDFVALELQSPAGALQEEKIGLLLHLKDDLTDIQLRTLEAQPLDAIFFERDVSPLTIARQMELQRVSALARKPLLLHVRLDVEKQELVCLREAGVALVGVDTRERGATEALRRLRGVIDSLPPRRRPRRDERPAVSLPLASASGGDEEDEDEDDDGE